MIPKRVELENFLSFGSPAVEIAFADGEPLWVLGGPNGVGKSAVFDAMTFCLFGCHRGGKQEADQLVHHGANGFRVAFEFEFNGADYRIIRGRSGKRATQRVEQRDAGGDWQAVVGVNSAADVKVWAERTLGLQYEQFTASVLLRQGEADAIITATGTKRLEILKQIIGVERFENLSKRIHSAAKLCKDRLETEKKRRDTLPDVSEEELANARTRFEREETARDEADRLKETAAVRVTAARQWAAAAEKLEVVEKAIADADGRAKDADHIRTHKVRLDELTAAVPLLQQIVTLRATLKTGQRTVEDRKVEVNRVAAALRALDLAQEIADSETFVRAVETAAKFPVDLAEQVTAAQAAASDKGEDLTKAVKARAAIEALLAREQERQTEFAQVDVGVKCSRCGQEVTAEHARREREEIDQAVRDLVAKCAAARDVELEKADAKKAADEYQTALTTEQRRQQAAADRVDELKRTRTGQGLETDDDELRRALPDQRLAHKQAEVDAGDQVQTDRKALERLQRDLGRKLTDAETAVATDLGRQTSLIEQLAPAWRIQLDRLDTAAIEVLDAERRGYVTGKVAERAHQLDRDVAQRAVWVQRSADLTAEIAAIAEDARIPVADAEQAAAEARTAAVKAGQAREIAKEVVNHLDHQAKERAKAVESVAKAEIQDRLHQKLDKWLGKDGLQRELVRSAEREIVRLADDTVRHLSDGDLTVELAVGGDDDAFDLRVRRADEPTPIGVDYLSGSQKFRVAVAVALAIGRYAAGQARPLESVIIDEGFGSLDRDGLAAMADELNRLKAYLQRIVLVSHQEEFADRFPVVIKLSRGPDGTVAEPVRR